MSSAGVPEESSRRSVQQLENSVGRAQFWCEEPACYCEMYIVVVVVVVAAAAAAAAADSKEYS